ncbi:MAG: 6-carboxytetrahydropterin synthase [Planctomycetota bacterium]|nr:6-carboxytetrahydropterin synthase [Planctomycetota bacterium]
MPTHCVEVQFCYGHRLLNYDGPCRNLHGHNGRAVILLEAENLVGTTAEVSAEISAWINSELDSRMILCREDPIVPQLLDLGEPVVLLESNPTTETVARIIFETLSSRGIPVQQVQLWESARSSVTYQPGGSPIAS